MNLDKFAADLIEALLKDFCETFPRARDVVATMDGDVYGWKVARAEALADRLKREMLLAPPPRAIDLDSIIKAALRDEFAMNAPEVPSWFKHTPAPGHPGYEPMPNLKNPEDQEGFGELPHHEQWAKRQVYNEEFNRLWKEQMPLREAHSKAMRAWQQADAMGRLTQWRWAYADAMLAARNHEPKPAIVEAKT